MRARAIERNTKQQTELEEAKAEIRQVKAERFGKKTEKQSASDRTNRLDVPKQHAAPKKKRGRQPGSPAPKRRDDSHLPARIQEVDFPPDVDCPPSWSATGFQAIIAVFVSQVTSHRISRCAVLPTPLANVYKECSSAIFHKNSWRCPVVCYPEDTMYQSSGKQYPTDSPD